MLLLGNGMHIWELLFTIQVQYQSLSLCDCVLGPAVSHKPSNKVIYRISGAINLGINRSGLAEGAAI